LSESHPENEQLSISVEVRGYARDEALEQWLHQQRSLLQPYVWCSQCLAVLPREHYRSQEHQDLHDPDRF
jgi:hypothetical protein